MGMHEHIKYTHSYLYVNYTFIFTRIVFDDNIKFNIHINNICCKS